MCCFCDILVSLPSAEKKFHARSLLGRAWVKSRRRCNSVLRSFVKKKIVVLCSIPFAMLFWTWLTFHVHIGLLSYPRLKCWRLRLCFFSFWGFYYGWLNWTDFNGFTLNTLKPIWMWHIYKVIIILDVPTSNLFHYNIFGWISFFNAFYRRKNWKDAEVRD